MIRSRRLAALAAGSVLALVASTAHVGAQDPCGPKPAPPKPETRWRFTVAPYLWAGAVNGTVGVGPVATNIDLSINDLLKALRFAAMGYGEARYGPWLLGVDATYVSLRNGRAIAFRGDTGSFDLTQHETMIQPVVGYAFGDTTWRVAVVAGGRYWNLNSDLDANRLNGTSNDLSKRVQWIDATGGLRVNWMPASRLRIVAAGDGGGGGSRGTWQAYGSFGYEFPSKFGLAAGYRALSIDYDHNGFLDNTTTQGPVLVASWRF